MTNVIDLVTLCEPRLAVSLRLRTITVRKLGGRAVERSTKSPRTAQISDSRRIITIKHAQRASIILLYIIYVSGPVRGKEIFLGGHAARDPGGPAARADVSRRAVVGEVKEKKCLP